ncbi:cupin domain-containing protein [Dietzia sp. ANT_WB102]|nr:cupin domain-containing protein [Dietzia sp. ANT_WB102]
MRHRVTRSTIALLAGVCVLAAAACTPDTAGQTDRGMTANGNDSLSPASTIAGTPPVLAVDIVQGTRDQAVDVQVDGGDEGVSVTFREITIEPGSSTGEHCHHGQLIAVVKQGALNHHADAYPDGVHIYRAGDAIIEAAGSLYEGRNNGMEDVILLVTYVTPVGMPLSETDLTKCSSR